MDELAPQKPAGKKRILLRFLVWWGLLVLGLFAFRTHQRLSRQTHVVFSTMLHGEPLTAGASVTLDGSTAINGQQISIGWHTLEISHPHIIPFSKRFFAW